MASDILIVDDEADIRDLVAGILDDEGFSTRTARDSDSALAEIANRRPHLVFLDIWLQGSKLDGLQLLEQINYTGVPIDFYNIGYLYDRQPWQVQMEFARRSFNQTSFGVDLDGYYLLAGYHLGKFTPYLQFSHLAHKSRILLTEVDTTPLSPGERAVVGAINANALAS